MDFFPDLDAEVCCPICRDLLRRPVLHKLCSHSFCAACLRMILKSAGRKCPICRTSLLKQDLRRNDDLNDLVTHLNITCSCGRILQGPEFSSHISTCPYELQKRQREYQQSQMKTAAPVNRWTFACPVCKESNMDREALLAHVKSHGHVSAECPLCAVLPWSRPGCESDLAAHLCSRHAFDLETLVHFDMTEEEMLEKAIKASESQLWR